MKQMQYRLPESVNVWVENALTDVFETSTAPADAQRSGAIHMLKNAAESIQVAIRPEEDDLTGVLVTVEPVEGLTITAYPIGNIAYRSFSNPRIGEYRIPDADEYRRADIGVPVPEYYLAPEEAVDVIRKDTTRSFCVEAVSTAETVAGTYRTNMVISSAQGICELPLTVRVYNGTLPEPEDSQLGYVCWSADSNDTFGVEKYSEEFWKIVGTYAKAMKKERQNALYLDIRALLMSGVTINPDGSYAFDFTNFDRYIETFLQYGSFKYLCGNHLAEKDFYIEPNDPLWPTNAVDVWTFVEKDGEIVVEWQYADAEAGVRHLRNLLSPLYAHLKEKGWDRMWLQHISDEVEGERPNRQVAMMYELVHEWMPTCRTIDAGFGRIMGFGERVDIPVPRLDFYSDLMDTCKAYQKKDKQVWIYTCNGPQRNAMSRLNDFPLLSTRVLGWYMWQHRIDGYLHWAWNRWTPDLYEELYNAGPWAVGDCYLVYPDVKNRCVREGTRATAMRDAMEDNELMRLAAEKDEEKVQAVVDELIRHYEDFRRDPDKYLQARIQLLEMLD